MDGGQGLVILEAQLASFCRKEVQMDNESAELTWRQSCEDCAHWEFHDDGTGHCRMQSVACATARAEAPGRKPPWFLHRAAIKDRDELGEGGSLVRLKVCSYYSVTVGDKDKGVKDERV